MACPVCFGGDDPVMRESLTAGIGVLVGITLVVLAGFAAFFVALARRASRTASAVDSVDAPSVPHAPAPPQRLHVASKEAV